MKSEYGIPPEGEIFFHWKITVRNGQMCTFATSNLTDPYCLMTSGTARRVEVFHYLIAELQQQESGLYTAAFHTESYAFNL